MLESVDQIIKTQGVNVHPEIQTIIFDIGNVLVDFRWKEFLNDYSYPPEIHERLAKAIFQNSLWWELDRHALPKQEMFDRFIGNDPELSAEITECLLHLGNTIEVFPYTIPLIERLKSEGFRVYFLSNYSKYLYDLTEEKLHSFTHLMDGGIYSYETGRSKPDPKFYQLFLDRFALEPASCLFLDDKSANVEAAKKLSIHAIEFHLPRTNA